MGSKNDRRARSGLFLMLLGLLLCCSCNRQEAVVDTECQRIVTDTRGKSVRIPEKVERFVCSGPGCLRYAVYLEAQDRVVGVDDLERRAERFKTRPYAIANPVFQTLPLIGNFRGFDNPELIVSLQPGPQLILKTYHQSGYNPDQLQAKAGLPVITLDYGELDSQHDDALKTLTLMGSILNKETRAAEVTDFFRRTMGDLTKRRSNRSQPVFRRCYIGGIAFKGTHGLLSTAPGYAPFNLVEVTNLATVAADGMDQKRHMIISKETLVNWNPDVIFLDASCLTVQNTLSVLHELKTDPVYRTLDAVKSGHIYCLLPHNSYTTNHGSMLANAYFIGTILWPDSFQDTDPTEKANEIYKFLVGKAVFDDIDRSFDNRIFKKLELD